MCHADSFDFQNVEENRRETKKLTFMYDVLIIGGGVSGKIYSKKILCATFQLVTALVVWMAMPVRH